MSIKTLRKRIAFVAVTALGAGLLTVASVVPASANIDADDLIVPALGSGNTVITICAVTTSGSTQSAVVPVSSPGFVIEPDASRMAGGDDAAIVVTGPGVISALGASYTAVSQTVATASALGSTDSADDDITIKPTGVGTIKVSYGESLTSATLDVVTITVVETCTSGQYSASLSYFTAVNDANGAVKGTSWATPSVVDDSGSTRITNGGTGFIRMQLNDSYGSDLSVSALIVSVTSGECNVSISDYAYGSAPSAGSGKTAVDADNGADDVVAIAQSTAGADKPQSCTVSATYGGTPVGTKTFTFEGAPAKITVADVMIADKNTATTGRYRVTVEDAAGNRISGQSITASGTQSDNAAALASGVITAVIQSGVATADSLGTAADGRTADVLGSGYAYYTCGKEGTAKLTVRTNVDTAASTYITSNPFTVVCSDDLDTWSISMDKATYAPGEIATLTVSGKSVGGNPVYTLQSMGSALAYSFGGMTAVTAPTTSDVFASGAGTKTYTFSVGTSEGSFVGTFKIAGSTDDTAKTVQYKVANQNAAVSTNEVLAAIVKLIATINKQIRQLQKQLRR